jgi:hypothetical protein
MRYLLILILTATLTRLFAQNPIIQTTYTADPAPMVYNDRLYVYTTHDEDKSTWFNMNNWRAYSTNDMLNWTDHGKYFHTPILNGPKEMLGPHNVWRKMVSFTFMFRLSPS